MEICQAGPGCARLRVGLRRLLQPVFPGLRLSLPGVLLWLCLTASFSLVLTSLLGPWIALCPPRVRLCARVAAFPKPSLFLRVTGHCLRVAVCVHFYKVSPVFRKIVLRTTRQEPQRVWVCFAPIQAETGEGLLLDLQLQSRGEHTSAPDLAVCDTLPTLWRVLVAQENSGTLSCWRDLEAGVREARVHAHVPKARTRCGSAGWE